MKLQRGDGNEIRAEGVGRGCWFPAAYHDCLGLCPLAGIAEVGNTVSDDFYSDELEWQAAIAEAEYEREHGYDDSQETD